MMPLVMGDSGQAYEIRKIGGNDEVRTHLASMGTSYSPISWESFNIMKYK